MKKYRSVLLVLIVAALVMTLVPVSFVSAKTKTKKMTVYDQVIKKGNYVYCNDGYRIYKVNLKNSKVKKLIKRPTYTGDMKLYKGYIYYHNYTTGTTVNIYRVKTNGKGNKRLASQDDYINFAISNNRIYYYDLYWNEKTDEEKLVKYSVKLNGKDRRKEKCKVKTTIKKTNKKGYKVIVKKTSNFEEGYGKGYAVSYLQKPNGKRIKLAKTYGEDIW